ncbi:MAG: NAD(P)(+) transhydrogenase (Re/Si-specific) subunit alpha [Gemmatimonadetes bacterium]|nr:NAD(P)(+) transhydrogenase (Re/Si-specific) subunit alpha [Gemmatimonadota bacterium]|tara:strand:+ start:9776 stop:10918 length:1143 start_codon:yes stop_codon:yes gene_type:complete
MRLAVLKETCSTENRVALVPLGVKALVKRGLTVTVQSGAGETSGISDLIYQEAGAEIASNAQDTLKDAKVVLVVNPPPSNALDLLSEGSILVGFLDPLSNSELVSRLVELNVTGISMELVPRITRAQSMDALSSQATVAGYKAVLLAANHLPKFLPMFTTAAGTIRPAKALILGAGVAGLQAIATARRLGAVVEAFDVRPAVKEQVESLGASFLESEEEVTAEGEGGYAKELTEDQHHKELELIGDALADTDIVITTAQIPGREAPVLITEDMVKTMKYGSVIVDLASESGGNCELSEAGETVLAHGVQILGPSNLPTSIPVHSSQMYSKNIVTLISEFLGEDGELQLDFENDVVGPSTVTHGGEVRNERVQSAMRSNSL